MADGGENRGPWVAWQAAGAGPDKAAVREKPCKSALVKSGITDYALNPYTGCTHGCVYCYASFMSRFSRHQLPWGRWVEAKINAAEVLERDLRRLQRQWRATNEGAEGGPEGRQIRMPGEAPAKRRPARPVEVMLSSVTDAYQPLERTYRLTRACLEVFAAAAGGQLWRSDAWLKISILTKSDLILRDLDVLQDLPGLEVGMTVTAVDDAVSRLYEPGAPPASRRLAALRRLADAGIRTWAFVSPVLPYHSDSPQALRSILGAIRDAGAARAVVDRLNPYPASVGRFLRIAPPEAARSLRGYVASPQAYLDRLRESAAEAAAGLGLPVRILF